MVAGNPVAWKSMKQSVIALSTTEAEYVTCSEVIKTVIHLQGLLIELTILPENTAIPCYIDNTGALAVANGEKVTRNVRHIDIRYHHIQDSIARGTIALQRVDTHGMKPEGPVKADVLTKALTHELHAEALRMLEMNTSMKI